MSTLLPGWESVIAASHRGTKTTALQPRVSLRLLANTTLHVASADGAEEAIRLLGQTPLSSLALAARWSNAGRKLQLRSGSTWSDIRSMQPSYVAVAGLASDKSGQVVSRVGCDLGAPGGIRAFSKILRMRIPVVAHDLKQILFVAWSLGLDPQIQSPYDTRLAAISLRLGKDHRVDLAAGTPGDRIRVEQAARQEHDHAVSLAGQCAQYQLAYPYSGTGPSSLDKVLVDAEWTLRLYLAQQHDVLAAGLHAHLHGVEFPFAVANARIEWNGVLVERPRLRSLAQAAGRAADHHAVVLRSLGVDPPGSREQFFTLD